MEGAAGNAAAKFWIGVRLVNGHIQAAQGFVDETGEFTERLPRGFFIERGEELF